MKNKSLMLGALIITLSVIIIGISGSYAYFTNSVTETNSANKGVSANSGNLKMDFTTSQYISATADSLIDDSQVTTKAHHTDFTVQFNNTTTVNSATYRLYLTDITMTNNFKSTYLKWALYDGTNKVAYGDFGSVSLMNGGSSCPTYSSGTPTSCTLSELPLINSVSLTKGTVKNYKLYIWLSNSEENQNSLLNGSFSAKVAFKATT